MRSPLPLRVCVSRVPRGSALSGHPPATTSGTPPATPFGTPPANDRIARLAMATTRDYSHRTAIQKLGVGPDQRVEVSGDVGPGLRRDVKEAIGRGLVKSGELDGAIVNKTCSIDEERSGIRFVVPRSLRKTAA